MSWLSSKLFGKQQQVKTNFDELGTIGKDYMDPFSKINQRALNQFTNQATDIVGQQGLNNQRAMAMGVNPFANEQNQAMLSTVAKSAGGGWQEWLQNANNIGTQALTNKANLTFERDKINAMMRQERQNAIGQFGGQLLGQFITSGIPGNFLGGMSNFVSPGMSQTPNPIWNSSNSLYGGMG